MNFNFSLQAIFAYWITSNLFTLGQVSLLRVPAVRRKFGIPEMIVHKTAAQKENFWEMFKAGELCIFKINFCLSKT